MASEIPASEPRTAEVRVQTVLFDLDGTLIDSTGATERAWHKWADAMGIVGYVHHGHGLPARDIVALHITQPRRAEALELARQLEEQETEGIEVKDGAAQLLAALPRARWGIVTSCTAALARVRLAAAGLAAPPLLVTADDVRRGKPSPEGYRAAAAALGFDPADCLVVEDTPAGLEAAHATGGLTLGVAGTVSAAELDADYVVESLSQVHARTDSESIVITLIATSATLAS